MQVETSLVAEDEQPSRRLIEEAMGMAADADGGLARALVGALFAPAAIEDLSGYQPDEIAALAEQAAAFLSVRKPGTPKIRFANPPAQGDRLKTISIIEIVNDDMPFLVDSVMAELAARDLSVRLVAHPVLGVTRDAEGRLRALAAQAKAAPARESFIHIHVDRDDNEIRREQLVQGLERVLADVRVSVADWRAILDRVGAIIAEMKSAPPPLPEDEIAEASQFLEWLVADNFTFLGARDYRIAAGGEPEPVPGSGLGVLRDPGVSELKAVAGRDIMMRELRAFIDEPKALMIAKASLRSRVHRRVFMDYISVKRYEGGRVVGEMRVVGLLTSTAYTRSTRAIPYIRRKIGAVIERAGFSVSGHSAKALANVLETYPRDELFQIDEDTLYNFALAIMQLNERPRVRVLPRRDRFGRFVSVLAFLPRDRATSDVVGQIGEFFGDIYGGHIGGLTLFLPESALVRAHYIVARGERDEVGPAAIPDRTTLEYGVSAIVRTWTDALAEQLALNYDPARAKDFFLRYRDAFSAGYRGRYAPAEAIADIRVIEGLSGARPLAVDFHGIPVAQHDEDANNVGLKVLSHDRPLPLSERVPVLENMGFRVVEERTSEIMPGSPDNTVIFLHDMVLERADGGKIDLPRLKTALEACFLVVMGGGAENDGYNALVLSAGLHWRDVALIRAVSRFLRQVQVPFSQDYMWRTLYRHAGIAARIVALFRVRFDPRLDIAAQERAHHEVEIAAEIETALGKVESLDEDRILRHFVNAMQSAIRTNFYQLDKDGQPKALLAMKYESRKLTTLAAPRPLYEIFVYSPRVEGVHLRFGKVARGGIRWSDRPQDFRTEILGLVKAQQVKNAVIVPVGAKGGFVPKRAPASPREAVQAEGVATYKLFIESLLDITDNLSAAGAVVPPPQVVRHDGDDPYLVVAADKGTATFSDIANEISLKHDFWLGDAFASGGSAGYDHKKMGITARGAWEAVKRHFREMDVDVGTTPFTVAGVGDMSGDVFGNGMLRERTIRLVAAFDHRDIFIDPDPDPEKSFIERKRLFDLPRSSWQDYDKALISKGGGVFPRNAKEVPLSAEARALLKLTAVKPTPQEVMSAILKAPVDLLFFGGIGTYVRASGETDADAGDRANDAIRVTGASLQCKVIGEGANLGMTQRGRIEAGQRGVRLNTDAIDNSAGVNTSDLEVNIKIALGIPVRAGQLSVEERNTFLGAMTGEVAQLVLRNNYQQTLAISLAERRGLEDAGFLQRLMQMLEGRGLLDRAVEFLPDDVEIAERRRRGQAFARPELAVLLAYAKLSLFDDLIGTPVPDDPYLARDLVRYFPQDLARRFPEALAQHRLRREIIATHLTNSIINRGGPSLIARMTDETGASPDRIAKAFAAVRDSYGMVALNGEIDALDNKVPGAVQLDLYAAVQNLLLDRLVWFLRNVDLEKGLDETVTHFGGGIVEVEAMLARALSEDSAGGLAAHAAELRAAGVSDALARRVANLPALAVAPDIVLVADRTGRTIADVTLTYFAARDFFRLDRLADAARGIVVSDYFDRLALDRARSALDESMRQLTAGMLGAGEPGPAAVEAWVDAHKSDVQRIRTAVHGIADSGLTLSKLAVAASLLGDLAGK